ncbi:MAG: hypothetical protein INH41_12935 [Myxococcaceae bacterium]|jgi:hypothetical protein|nr:hypothetical protein [Myxococcaceae bacterium]MCA3013289.1 hypothetical protein [Myxococcaceae bacterium]
MRAGSLALALACALWGCTPEDFPTESLVDRLRMLGITSSPADLAPGETARLSALVLDPTRAGATTTFWIACDPDPFNENRSACTDPSVVNDPSRLGDVQALPPGLRFAGLNASASYTAPRGLFDVLASDDPRRVLGTVGTLVTISVAEEVSPAAPMAELAALFGRVQRREVASLVSLFRVRISEDPERNTNPRVSRLVVDGADWPTGARLMVRPGQDVVLDADAADAAFEPFTAVTPSGSEARTERILVSWYSTAGRFSETRTAMREEVKTTFSAPGKKAFDPVPERRAGTLWTVLRDTRGGLSWSEFPFFVCDEALPAPEVTAVRAPAGRDDPVVVEGRQLDSVLDVIVGGVALTRGRADASGARWSGSLPADVPPGEKAVVVHTRRCERLEAPSVTVR